ncbi:protein-L-isoaspartate O-methyltransferase family protein [Streptomyces cinereoruber]|uniref:protein-L-isoaspartate O-methyltransferase family protein n=1 Tax=Streptomyces cinereoruber TaxID=67260 RepID=UPI003640252C
MAQTPRETFVPRWFQRRPDGDGYELFTWDKAEDWFSGAFADRSLITRVGTRHVDHVQEGEVVRGLVTSSATQPSLVVKMLRHGVLQDASRLLYVGTGSGYGPALAARRLGEDQVVGIDVDPYLVKAAQERLYATGLHPQLHVADATGVLPVAEGEVDRIVAMVSVRSIPTSWLDALPVGGRLVTTIAGTSLLVTAEKNAEGGASGRVEWDRAGFMTARRDPDYGPRPDALAIALSGADGESVTAGPYPVVDVEQAWDLASLYDLTTPGVVHQYTETDGVRTAYMAHHDGSWARAQARGIERPTVHQSGPRRLWDDLDAIRTDWLARGEIPLRGARVIVKPDGRTVLARGGWHIVT